MKVRLCVGPRTLPPELGGTLGQPCGLAPGQGTAHFRLSVPWPSQALTVAKQEAPPTTGHNEVSGHSSTGVSRARKLRPMGESRVKREPRFSGLGTREEPKAWLVLELNTAGELSPPDGKGGCHLLSDYYVPNTELSALLGRSHLLYSGLLPCEAGTGGSNLLIRKQRLRGVKDLAKVTQ